MQGRLKGRKLLFDLKLLFLKTMFEWMNASGLFSFASLADMLDSSVFLCLMLVSLLYTSSVLGRCLFFY
jgi:hypothetical protein